MKTLTMAFTAAVTLFLAGCVYVTNTPPALSLTAPKQSIMSGEIVTLSANAYDTYGGSLSYQWEEDGVTLDWSGSTFAYSRFVEIPTTVTIRVTVTNELGYRTPRTLTLLVNAPVSPASLLVVNNSPYTVMYLHLCAVGESDWGPDVMRPSDVILPGTSYTLRGIPGGTWNLKAMASNNAAVWTNIVGFAPSQTQVFTLH